ncbi:WD40-repeat-containing domain protein [Mycena olivaceomarginata]|nr:WD40-repeat-containing domain protein [Mycena olivaceomarginata]
MSFLLHRTSKHNSYILQSKLRGHSGGIVRLRATEDGRLLASRGTDGTKIWDLTTMCELGSPKSPETRGPSPALVWIKREDDLGEALFHGTQNGQLELAVFEEISCVRIVNPAEITSLAFDPPFNRLAVCHRGCMVQIYTLSGTMSLKEVFLLELQNVAPRAIVFGQMYFNDKDIMVFGLYGGDIYTFRGNNGKAVGEPWNIGALIGDIALDVCKGVLIMDEPSSGTNLYRMEDHTCVKTFPIAVTKQKRLHQVDFLEECQFIVSRSDHGIVYVFDHRSGDIVDELRVDPREWVQTIAAADCAGVSTIFAARSRDLVGSNKNFVWHKKSKKTVWCGGHCVRSSSVWVPELGQNPNSLSTTADVVRRQGQTPSLTHAEALAELRPALIPVGTHCTLSLAHAGALAELRPAPIPVGALYMTSHQPPTHLTTAFVTGATYAPLAGHPHRRHVRPPQPLRLLRLLLRMGPCPQPPILLPAARKLQSYL